MSLSARGKFVGLRFVGLYTKLHIFERGPLPRCGRHADAQLLTGTRQRGGAARRCWCVVEFSHSIRCSCGCCRRVPERCCGACRRVRSLVVPNSWKLGSGPRPAVQQRAARSAVPGSMVAPRALSVNRWCCVLGARRVNRLAKRRLRSHPIAFSSRQVHSDGAGNDDRSLTDLVVAACHGQDGGAIRCVAVWLCFVKFVGVSAAQAAVRFSLQ
jgi:hypothetical protein